jgi:ABC-2 type transport system ATP-binding protein
MRQRLGVAAALLGDPSTLILDEPVNGLDPEGVRWIRSLMRDLAGAGRTVLVSSHLISEMALTADHLLVIGAGRLLADTGINEFTAGHPSLEAAYFPSRPAQRRIAAPSPGPRRAGADDDAAAPFRGALTAEWIKLWSYARPGSPWPAR